MGKYEGDYYIGLDMGTGSVGWAVTDTSYHILRAKGKDMWGARMFDEARTAVERRTNRINRRRRAREKARISMLQELLEDEIKKVDPGFYHRLEESKYWLSDRTGANEGQKYAIFAKGTSGDKEYTDSDYYKEYPTIFHLRSELTKSNEAHDVRLVYLALLNMFKHRGHFLNETLGVDGGAGLDDAWNTLVDGYSKLETEEEEAVTSSLNPFDIVDRDLLVKTILKKGVSKSQIREDAAKILKIVKKDKKEYTILSLICGLSGNLEDIFGKDSLESITEKSKKTINFRKSSYEEDIAAIQDALNEENMSFVLALKEVHDVLLLDQIMQGHQFLCDARVEMYEQHKEDLVLLKKVVKRLSQSGKISKQAYSDLFRKMQDGSYSAYVGSTNSDKENGKVRRYVADHATQKKNFEPDELYKTIKGLLSPYKEEGEVAKILDRIESETFLRKQLTASNGVIPNQVYLREMKAILKNAEQYIPSFKEKDESGLTKSERILKLFAFHMPYYVGPVGGLTKNNGNKWAVRISDKPITPWNINDVIDMGKTRQAFIENLIRHCTYLKGEKVLPKRSLIYEKFMVLNELNNLTVAGEPITVDEKQDIFNTLFMKGKTVTAKQICDYFKNRGKEIDKSLIGGIEDRFQNSLSTIGKFNGIFETPYLDRKHVFLIEDIVLLGTIYGDSKKQFREMLQSKYGKSNETDIILSEKQIQRIAGFKFSDWGRFSRAFLEMEGASHDDGVVRTIINTLWETNDNLMQILSADKYTYSEELQDMVKKEEKKLSDWSIDDLSEMYLSAPVKRMVWQTLRILNEIEEVMGRPPKRVFVEMTRENKKKGERTKSRKNQLIELFKNPELKKEQRNWLSELEGHTEQEFRIKKLYLYYCQMGRCMYTNEPIDIERLMDDNLYDIDHIYPRHFVKDDSIENNLVLVKKEKNAHKSDEFPIETSIQQKCYGLWKSLYDKKLIKKEKFERLTRKTGFTLDERVGFVKRQLVETGQGTKAITQIIQESLPQTSDMVFSKAGVVSQFRHDFDIYKCRSVNDFHHAQDAYLNIVVGNVYFTKFTKNPRNFIKEAMADSKDENRRYHLSKMFERTVQRGDDIAWISEKNGHNNTINLVKKQVFKTTPIITRRSYVATGAITSKETVWGKQKTEGSAAGVYFPMKTSDARLSDVTKYGGKSGVSTGAYSLISYREGDKEIRSIESIPSLFIKDGELDDKGKEKFIRYCSLIISQNSKKKCSEFRIIYPVIKFNSLMRIDGYYYYIGGKTDNSYYLYNAVPLKLSATDVQYIKKVEKAIKNNDYCERNNLGELFITEENNINFFEAILNKICCGIYLKRKGKVFTNLANSKEKFNSLGIPEQCNIIQKIVLLFAANTQTVDLSPIGKTHEGKVTLSKYIESLNECVLINQSVTGLFENEVDLLHI